MVIVYLLQAALLLLLTYILLLGVCSLLVSPNKQYEKDSPFYRFLLNATTAVGLKLLRVKVHVTGAEKIPQSEKLLFISNHRSNFDPIVTWYAFKKWKIAFLSKAENFHIPFFGRIIRKCCFMAIDRQSPRKALATINSAAQLLANREVSIGVYPEGTRSKSCELLPFHNGVLKIAQKANTAIVVLTVCGTERIHARTPFRKTDVYLDVAAIIPAQNVIGAKTEVLGEELKNMMAASLAQREHS